MADLFQPRCADKNRLLAEYNRAVSEWSETVDCLRDQVGRANLPALQRKVKEARAKAQGAKLVYTTHVNEHGQLWTYRAWAEWMDAESWAALRQNHSRAPADGAVV